MKSALWFSSAQLTQLHCSGMHHPLLSAVAVGQELQAPSVGTEIIIRNPLSAVTAPRLPPSRGADPRLHGFHQGLHYVHRGDWFRPAVAGAVTRLRRLGVGGPWFRSVKLTKEIVMSFTPKVFETRLVKMADRDATIVEGGGHLFPLLPKARRNQTRMAAVRSPTSAICASSPSMRCQGPALLKAAPQFASDFANLPGHSGARSTGS
jgi:hypothetical protein